MSNSGKSDEYYILNPFAAPGSNEELQKVNIAEMGLSEKKVDDDKEETLDGVEFNISEEDDSPLVRVKDGEEIELTPGLKKICKNDGVVYEIAHRNEPYWKIRIIGWSLVLILFITSIFPWVQIIGSFIVGGIWAKILTYRLKREIYIKDKIISVNGVSYPVNKIKSLAVGEDKEIFLEREPSFELMSYELMLAGFNKNLQDIDFGEKRGDSFKVIANVDGNDFVLAKNLTKLEAGKLFASLTA